LLGTFDDDADECLRVRKCFQDIFALVI